MAWLGIQKLGIAFKSMAAGTDQCNAAKYDVCKSLFKFPYVQRPFTKSACRVASGVISEVIKSQLAEMPHAQQ